MDHLKNIIEPAFENRATLTSQNVSHEIKDAVTETLVHCQFNLDGYLESKALALDRAKAKALDSNSRQKHLDNVLASLFIVLNAIIFLLPLLVFIIVPSQATVKAHQDCLLCLSIYFSGKTLFKDKIKRILLNLYASGLK